ncbi:hypothetical protein ACUWCN_28550, partial [Klebsiella pneumoniae]|uniref:hypothetical protein n=1 Tax=Klebsiella pneumoniae TaxID=573 RepID=UPI0040558DF1
FEKSCQIKKSTNQKDVPWWNRKLEKMKRTVRQLFNKAKKYSQWAEYKRALTEYNKEIRRAKRRTWHEFCEDIENTSKAARLQKALAKDHSNGLGLLRNKKGQYTKNQEETLEVLMSTHFPESSIIHKEREPEEIKCYKIITGNKWEKKLCYKSILL